MEEVCCPRFDPTHWDKKNLVWKDKRFIKESVKAVFNVPLNYGAAMARIDTTIKSANAEIPHNLIISEHTSKWNINVYAAVDQEIPGARNVSMSGHYISKVYEGGFNNLNEWLADFHEYIEHRTVEQFYFWYTTCPKCAKKYGKNYVVIIAKMYPQIK